MLCAAGEGRGVLRVTPEEMRRHASDLHDASDQHVEPRSSGSFYVASKLLRAAAEIAERQDETNRLLEEIRAKLAGEW